MIETHLALGGNLGFPAATFRQAINLLASRVGQINAISSFYRTAPLRLPGSDQPQPEYLNAVLSIDTSLSPTTLLSQLQLIERELGLDRTKKGMWGARPIDLDILSYAGQIVHSPELTIPHPRMRERDFVLLPLAEISPAWRDPISGSIVQDLLKQLIRSQAELFVREVLELRSDLESELLNRDSTSDKAHRQLSICAFAPKDSSVPGPNL